jgi:hypothetical protein
MGERRGLFSRVGVNNSYEGKVGGRDYMKLAGGISTNLLPLSSECPKGRLLVTVSSAEFKKEVRQRLIPIWSSIRAVMRIKMC